MIDNHINTLFFGTVKIKEVFLDQDEAEEYGYTEAILASDPTYAVVAKHLIDPKTGEISANDRVFAAYFKIDPATYAADQAEDYFFSL